MRWVWLDRFEEFVPGVRAVGVKNVTLAEDHLHDHFPGFPVMPASLMIEGMAQTAGVLCISSGYTGAGGRAAKKVFFLTIDKARFRKQVRPGDTIEYHMTKTARKKMMWWYRGEAKVNGGLVAEAEVGAMIADA